MKMVVLNARNLGLSPLLVTYTMRHNAGDSLQQTVADLIDAYKSVTSGRAWQDIRERNRLYGYIRALEFTHGANGWHPHLHVLMLCDTQVFSLGEELSYRWSQKLKAVGRTAAKSIGCDVRQSNDAIVDYIAKWGREPKDPEYTKGKYWSMEHEVAKASSKRAASGNRNPFQILEDTGTGDRLSLSLFETYAMYTKGRRQLEWSRSPNLHRAFAMMEQSDEDIAAQNDDNAVMLARLSVRQWHVVLRVQAVSTLMDIAARGTIAELQDFLEDIGVGNATWSVEP